MPKPKKLAKATPVPTIPPLPQLTPELYAEIQLAGIEDRNRRALGRIELFRFLGGLMIVGVSVCVFAFYTFYMPVKVAHGETTTITLFQQFLAEVNVYVYAAWGAAALGAAYGATERRRRKKEGAEKDATIKVLQDGLLKVLKAPPKGNETPPAGGTSQ